MSWLVSYVLRTLLCGCQVLRACCRLVCPPPWSLLPPLCIMTPDTFPPHHVGSSFKGFVLARSF